MRRALALFLAAAAFDPQGSGAAGTALSAPFVTECPAFHPQRPDYRLFSVAFHSYPDSLSEHHSLDSYTRDELWRGTDDYSFQTTGHIYRSARMSCRYRPDGNSDEVRLMLPIPGKLWRCEEVWRAGPRDPRRHLWAWCISLLEE